MKNKHDIGQGPKGVRCDTALHVSREGGIVWIEGCVQDNRFHKHHALQLTWAVPGTVATLQTDGCVYQGRSLIVEGGFAHALSLEYGLIALMDSASSTAHRLRARYLGGGGAAQMVLDGWDGSLESARALLRACEDERQSAMDERVGAVLDWLDAQEAAGVWDSVSLAGALAVAHLSRGRFLHLFSSEVGSPWRTYLVWRRALVAITLALHGATLTEAAHAAGYSDSAHLSRQFVALFGVAPSVFIKNSHFVQV